ncbi:UNVERIFIED_CONTAM: hypothetical protein PYX00_002251 [Menopon gallinae]|uniref:Uncharacterized protein n=1 Tax=Menopon gallinae TaxID=328185 RepID=A0AAW2IGJ7_9NEOP
MGLTSKLFLLFVVCITFQAAFAWPHFSISKWTDVGYDINRAADDVERDIRKDLLNTKNKIWKETSKIINKGRFDESAIDCIVEKQVEQLELLDRTFVEARECIDNVRSEVNAITSEGRPELIMLKNKFKNQVKDCRNNSKDVFKTSQKVFQQNAMICTSTPRERE